jgi:hypothetical protein
MKSVMNVALGIAASIGGFLDVGAIATAALAGAAFGFQMLWVLAIGTLCVMLLTEMAGRLACVSHHSLVDAVRERCGFPVLFVPADWRTARRLSWYWQPELAALPSRCTLVTGIRLSVGSFRLVAFALWVLIWLGTFSIVQNGASLLAWLITWRSSSGCGGWARRGTKR